MTMTAARNAPTSTARQENVEAAQATAPVPAGALCPRCDRNALFGLECAHCGRIIITGLIGGPRPCPAEERAQATGRPYCPKCYTVDAQLYVTGAGDMCGPCAARILGRRVADLQVR